MFKNAILLLILNSYMSFGQGLSVDIDAYGSIPEKQYSFTMDARKLPEKVDLSKYIPLILNQGSQNICVGTSTAYLRTILEAKARNITNKNGLKKIFFSPTYIYNAIKDSSATDCQGTTDILDALNFMRDHDLALLSEQTLPHCKPNVKIANRPESRILDFVKLFGLNDSEKNVIYLTQKALAEESPILIGLLLTPELNKYNFFEKMWQRIKAYFGFEHSLGLWEPSHSNTVYGHAVCLVGYDHAKFGGAFKVVNSYGSKWGDKGFFWIRYRDFYKYAKYAYQVFLPEKNIEKSLSADISVGFNNLASSQEDFEINPKIADNKPLEITYKILKPQETDAKFKFQVKVPRQTYLYLIGFNDVVKNYKMFPVVDKSSPLISKNSMVFLPSKDSVYHLVPPTGLETISMLFSSEPLNMAKVVKDMNTFNGLEQNQIIDLYFRKKLVPQKFISYKDKKLGFFLKKGFTGTIVPVILQVQHVHKKRPTEAAGPRS